VYGSPSPANVPCYQCGWTPERDRAAVPEAADSKPVRQSVIARPAAYSAPAVHWPGNPPVWERPGHAATIEEAQVRDLARRALGELRRE
jgi:hypothetical protein